VCDHVVLDVEFVEHFPRIGEIFRPLARQRDLAGLEEESLAPLGLSGSPAIEGFEDPARVDFALAVPGSNLARLAAGRRTRIAGAVLIDDRDREAHLAQVETRPPAE